MSPTPTLYARSTLHRASSIHTLPPLVGGHLALDFLNTVANHATSGIDDILGPGYVNVIDWSLHSGILASDEGERLLRLANKDPREAASVRRRMTGLRSALYPIVQAIVLGEDLSALDMSLPNAERLAAEASRQLIADGTAVDLTWREPCTLDRPLHVVALAATDLLRTAPGARLRQCDAPDCEQLFLDTSRSGQRRYCSANRCGTVERVRRFRERQRQADTGTLAGESITMDVDVSVDATRNGDEP